LGLSKREGGYIFTGVLNSRILLINTDEQGDIVWANTYDWGAGADYGLNVIQTSDGGYLVSGYSFSFGAFEQALLMKTDGAGELVWGKVYGEAEYDRLYNVVELSEGFIAGGHGCDTGEALDKHKMILLKTIDGTLGCCSIFADAFDAITKRDACVEEGLVQGPDLGPGEIIANTVVPTQTPRGFSPVNLTPLIVDTVCPE